MTVRVETKDRIFTVIIDRPEVSHALDLILTGRPVDADEARSMGLANRIVPHGDARKAAEILASQIAEFPQVCMRSDRLSAYQQWELPFKAAMQNEFKHGLKTIQNGETLEGAVRFTQGEGRHGKF